MNDKARNSSHVDKFLSKRDLMEDKRILQNGGNLTNSTSPVNATIPGNATANETTIAPTKAPTFVPTPAPTPDPTTFVDRIKNQTGNLRGSSEAASGALSFLQKCEDVNVTETSGNVVTNEECSINKAAATGVAAGVVGILACAVLAGCATTRCGQRAR